MIFKYLTLQEAAEALRVSEATIRRWIKSDKLPAKKAGRKYLIAEHDIPTFLREYEKTKDA